MKKNIWYAVIVISLLIAVYAVLGILQSASMSETPKGEGSADSFHLWLIVIIVAMGTTLFGIYALYKRRAITKK